MKKILKCNFFRKMSISDVTEDEDFPSVCVSRYERSGARDYFILKGKNAYCKKCCTKLAHEGSNTD